MECGDKGVWGSGIETHGNEVYGGVGVCGRGRMGTWPYGDMGVWGRGCIGYMRMRECGDEGVWG